MQGSFGVHLGILMYRQIPIYLWQCISIKASTLWTNAKFQTCTYELTISRRLKIKDFLDVDVKAP
jgi:hypothetical protein